MIAVIKTDPQSLALTHIAAVNECPGPFGALKLHKPASACKKQETNSQWLLRLSIQPSGALAEENPCQSLSCTVSVSSNRQLAAAVSECCYCPGLVVYNSFLSTSEPCDEFQLWQEVPLLTQLLMSRLEESQEAERAWLLQLLVAGMQGPLDGDVCRYARVAMPRIRIERRPKPFKGQKHRNRDY